MYTKFLLHSKNPFHEIILLHVPLPLATAEVIYEEYDDDDYHESHHGNQHVYDDI